MKAFFLALLVALVAASTEKWSLVERSNPTKQITFRLGLFQQNFDKLDAALLDVSDPRSENYGKWWTREQILDLVAPPKEKVDNLISLLSENGIKVTENNRDFLTVRAAVENVEKFFSVEMYKWKHESGRTLVRSKAPYTIPKSVENIVEIVVSLSELPVSPRRRAAQPIDATGEGNVTPYLLKNAYNIPSSYQGNSGSTMCLAEFQGYQSFEASDLTQFIQVTSIPTFNVSTIIGPYSPGGGAIESALDVQYGGSVALDSTIWYWTVDGWMMEFATDLANRKSFPLVVSMSWAWTESDQCQISGCKNSENYVNRCNKEFAKATMRGITLLAASGDQGAPGDGNYDCNSTPAIGPLYPASSPYILAVGATMLAPGVGNGQIIKPDTSPVCSVFPCANNTNEATCTWPTSLITSGGGFSNYFPMPSWQSKYVQNYLSSGVTLPPSSMFNASNRAYPDVSALGNMYIIVDGGDFWQVAGTSCSSPVWAGMISMLNSYRLNNNKSPLGFINPVIYSAYAAQPNIFKDISGGNNYCTEYCCTDYGYVATKGWDPVTGLGTPNFQNLLNYIKTLN
eukprot:TRINITY_DN3431_c0_g1_i5.p1 TRINITY_DN3431_c0_g1~~TRINITY_DN3431_c0_g1_i5.p1  ORF type:complete len:570 (+),score=138.61 TRINITY_DN3431_c0_g1_i5:94-1803(+)